MVLRTIGVVPAPTMRTRHAVANTPSLEFCPSLHWTVAQLAPLVFSITYELPQFCHTFSSCFFSITSNSQISYLLCFYSLTTVPGGRGVLFPFWERAKAGHTKLHPYQGGHGDVKSSLHKEEGAPRGLQYQRFEGLHMTVEHERDRAKKGIGLPLEVRVPVRQRKTTIQLSCNAFGFNALTLPRTDVNFGRLRAYIFGGVVCGGLPPQFKKENLF